jgi:hypothetical protein
VVILKADVVGDLSGALYWVLVSHKKSINCFNELLVVDVVVIDIVKDVVFRDV